MFGGGRRATRVRVEATRTGPGCRAVAAVGLGCEPPSSMAGQPGSSRAAALGWFLPGPSGWCYLSGPGPGLQSLLS